MKDKTLPKFPPRTPRARLPKKPCLWCGQEFQPLSRKHHCCSFACRIANYDRRTNPPQVNTPKLYTHTCEECGKSYHSRAAKQKYCSPACRAAGDRSIRYVQPNDQAKDRPYYPGTAALIRKWHSQGESLEELSKQLCRSVDNLQHALQGLEQVPDSAQQPQTQSQAQKGGPTP